MTRYHIRPAHQADIDQLKCFEQAVIEAEKPFNDIIKTEGAFYYDLDDLINNENNLLLVMEDNGNAIASGYIKIQASKPSLQHTIQGYLGFMYVHPNYRGQGLNQLVIKELISWAQQKGVKDFYLDVYCQNQSAINAYQKLGFTPSLLEMKLHT